MRILFVIPALSTGGIERMVLTWADALQKQGIVCEILAFKDGISREFNERGIKSYVVKSVSLNLVKAHKALKDFFELHKNYSAVHSNVSFYNGLVSHCVKETIGKQCITVSHAHSNGANRYSSLFSKVVNETVKAYLKREIKKNSDLNLACSYASGNFLFGKGNFTFFPNAIDVKRFSFQEKIREKYRNEYKMDGKFCILHVGRFSTEKNHLFLLEVFKKISAQMPNAELYLLGTGELLENVISVVNKSEIRNRVHFMGFRTDTEHFYCAADVFVLPSLIEGFPVSIVEAQATGLRVVASTAIPKETGITDLVTFMDLDDTKEAWAKTIIGNGLSKSKRGQYNEQVIEAGFDIEHEVEQLKRIYSDRG